MCDVGIPIHKVKSGREVKDIFFAPFYVLDKIYTFHSLVLDLVSWSPMEITALFDID